MIRKYDFCDGGEIFFDDTKSVRELIEYAFGEFGYYEPFGMDKVTLFQPHHPETHVGWFTTDTERCCADEIKEPENLCFAYHIPGVLYYAEGGWGHHMKELGNHPLIPDAVSIGIRFEDFSHEVIINGNYSFRDIINMFQNAEYIPQSASRISVFLTGIGYGYSISFSDAALDLPLTEFMKRTRTRSEEIQKETGKYIYHENFEIN